MNVTPDTRAFLFAEGIDDVGEDATIHDICKSLRTQKILGHTYYQDEMPGPLAMTIKNLVRARASLPTGFKLRPPKTKLPNHILHTPRRQQEKLLAFDAQLRAEHGLKLFFVLCKKIPLPLQSWPDDAAACEWIRFFVRPAHVEHHTETDDHVVADICCIRDEASFGAICLRGHRSEAFMELRITPNHVRYYRSLPPRSFPLATAIHIVQASVEHQQQMISFGNNDWSDAQIAFIADETSSEAESIAYFQMLTDCFLRNEPYRHAAHVFSLEDRAAVGLHMLVRFRRGGQSVAAMDRDQACQLARLLTSC